MQELPQANLDSVYQHIHDVAANVLLILQTTELKPEEVAAMVSGIHELARTVLDDIPETAARESTLAESAVKRVMTLCVKNGASERYTSIPDFAAMVDEAIDILAVLRILVFEFTLLTPPTCQRYIKILVKFYRSRTVFETSIFVGGNRVWEPIATAIQSSGVLSRLLSVLETSLLVIEPFSVLAPPDEDVFLRTDMKWQSASPDAVASKLKPNLDVSTFNTLLSDLIELRNDVVRLQKLQRKAWVEVAIEEVRDVLPKLTVLPEPDTRQTKLTASHIECFLAELEGISPSEMARKTSTKRTTVVDRAAALRKCMQRPIQ